MQGDSSPPQRRAEAQFSPVLPSEPLSEVWSELLEERQLPREATRQAHSLGGLEPTDSPVHSAPAMAPAAVLTLRHLLNA